MAASENVVVIVVDSSRSAWRCVAGRSSGAVVGSRAAGAAPAAGKAVAAGFATVAVAVGIAVVVDVEMVINCALHVICCFALRRLVVRWSRVAIAASTGSGSCG